MSKRTQDTQQQVARVDAIVEMWNDRMHDVASDIHNVIDEKDEAHYENVWSKFERVARLADELKAMAETNMVLVSLADQCPHCGFKFGTSIQDRIAYDADRD